MHNKVKDTNKAQQHDSFMRPSTVLENSLTAPKVRHTEALSVFTGKIVSDLFQQRSKNNAYGITLSVFTEKIVPDISFNRKPRIMHMVSFQIKQ